MKLVRYGTAELVADLSRFGRRSGSQRREAAVLASVGRNARPGRSFESPQIGAAGDPSHRVSHPTPRATDSNPRSARANVRRRAKHSLRLFAIKTVRTERSSVALDKCPAELADECESGVLGPDGWPIDYIDPYEFDPCPTCGMLEMWETAARQLAVRAMRPADQGSALLNTGRADTAANSTPEDTGHKGQYVVIRLWP